MRRRTYAAVLVVGVAASLAAGAARGRASFPPLDLLPPPTFAWSSSWLALDTGPTVATDALPQAWAITPESNFPRVLDLFAGLRSLSKDGILIWASTAGRGGATRTFKPSTWPLRLSSFRVDKAWEGQPARNVQQRLSWTAVGGWHLDVRVYFATQRPSPKLLREAQAELNRLSLP